MAFWDAETYDIVSDAQEKWARSIIQSKEWDGKEVLLDAGCGSGRTTKLLADKITQGQIYAIDNDANMVKKAKDKLMGFKSIKIFQADLLDFDSSQTTIRFDIVFSNAVLHWVSDHKRAFRNFYGLLKENGQLLIQCGGHGNLQNTIAIIDQVKESSEFNHYFLNWKKEWNFAKPMETEAILTELGFKDAKVYLKDAPVTFSNKGDYSLYLKTVILGPYLKYLPSGKTKAKFIESILTLIRNSSNNPSHELWTLDYVRLNIFASR
jgi:trans-aconitate 2-methyltransferase